MTVNGRMVAATTGLPLVGVKVTVGTQTFTTLANGVFAFTGVPTTVLAGTATLAGYNDKGFTYTAPTGSDPVAVGDIVMVVTSTDDPPPGPYTVWGTVSLTGLADGGGTQIVVVGRSETYLIPNGATKYYLWLPKGTYTLRASRTGFTTKEASGVAVTDLNTAVRHDFSLTP